MVPNTGLLLRGDCVLYSMANSVNPILRTQRDHGLDFWPDNDLSVLIAIKFTTTMWLCQSTTPWRLPEIMVQYGLKRTWITLSAMTFLSIGD